VHNPKQRPAAFLMGRVMGWVLAAMGVVIGGAGAWLAALGGAWY
jgi:hypothetical protein